MPPVVCCRFHWNVGSDDFVLPAIQALAVALFNLSLLLSCLVTLFAVDPRCSIPVLVYAPLLAMSVVQVLFLLNEGAILILSGRGSIWRNTTPRKHITKFIFIRALIAVLEFSTLLVSSIGVWLPSSIRPLLACPHTTTTLHVTRAIIFFHWIVYFCFFLKVLIYIDPLGCFSPGLLEHISFLDGSREQVAQEVPVTMATDGEDVLLTRQVSYWVSPREQLFRRVSNGRGAGRLSAEKVAVQKTTVSHSRMRRRLGALLCCLCVRNERSVGVALEEVARGFYTIFGDTGRSAVLTDIIAGLRLVHHDLKNNPNLSEKFRKATFRMMPSTQRYGLDPETVQKDSTFDWTNEDNQLLFEDLVHYMHYAMGVYGWTMHVFDNLCCGLCQLSSLTCCRCQYRCFSEQRRSSFIGEGCCMCSIGALTLQTGLQEEDVLYLSYENKVFSPPFCVCRDHQMKAVVVCIRGTLSFKDSLTDMSYSPVYVEVAGVRDSYVHSGMLKAALHIMNVLCDKQLLQEAFVGYEGYRLVITGHSLGAGVASVLALLVKLSDSLKIPNLVCYAFSPPGSLFSFPLAQYCNDFITAIVLGNDIVPRISLRSLLYLKFAVVGQLENCHLPKYVVLLHKRAVREAYASEKANKARNTLEDLVCNDSTTQNWLRDKIFNRTDKFSRYGREVSSVEKNELQKSLSIHPKDTSIVTSGLFDLAISLHPRASVLSASLFEAGGEPLPDPVTQHVATPGTTLDKAAPQILQHCQAHDGNTFLPLFPPGRILHITSTKSTTSKATWCCSGVGSEHEVTVREVHNENLGLILVDKGMVEDHLPNHVLAALKLCWDKLLLDNEHYDASKIKQLREKKEKLYRRVFRACKDGEQTKEAGFTFLINETPMVTEPRRLSASKLARQREMQHQLELPSLTVTTADVHIESDAPMDTTVEDPAQELVAPRGTRPQHLNLVVPIQSHSHKLHVQNHSRSETLV